MQNTNIKDKLSPKQVFTVPNLLSFLRLLLIPFIVWLYVGKQEYLWTLILIIFSLLTDIVDGFIARKYDVVTDFGKFIDPVADKLTQLAVLFCLVTRFPLIWIPIIALIIKEVLQFILRFIIFKMSGQIFSAEWHGKLATGLIYVMMSLHVIWFEITDVWSKLTIGITTAVILLSCILYNISTIVTIASLKKEKHTEEKKIEETTEE